MDNEKSPYAIINIEALKTEVYSDVYSFYNIIYHDEVKVQYKWKKYYKKDLYARYNHRIPAYIPTWKVYDTSQLIDSLPGEIERVNPIIPPDGYKVTNNTKIKYLEPYPTFIKYADEYIGDLDENGRFENPGAYLISWFRKNNYDDGITAFYEELYEERDGDIMKMMMDFAGIYPIVVQELRDKYMEIMMKESGEV